MSAVATRMRPEVEDAMKNALASITGRGFTISEEANEALADLIQSGYAELATSRRLDQNTAESRQAIQTALANLNTFVNRWIEEETKIGSRRLTLRTFSMTQSSVCPVFPFD